MKELIVILLIFSSSILMAQEHEHENTSHESHESTAFHHGRNFISFEYGYTHITEAVPHHDIMMEEGHWVSSFGIDYFRLINEKWRLGIKLDYELGHYIIPHKQNLKRENVFIALPTAFYSILQGWAVYGGTGIELEESKNLFVCRLGTEYAFDLGNGWEFPIGFFGDFKKGYNTYALTFGIGKIF